jgi:hypothetical protein
MILTNTRADFTVPITFTDIVATIAAIASARTLIQNTGMTTIFVAARPSGGAPVDTQGLRLQPGEGIEVNAGQVWLRSAERPGNVTAHTLVP